MPTEAQRAAEAARQREAAAAEGRRQRTALLELLSFVTAPDADADASALTTRLADFLPTMLPGCSAVVLHEMADSAPAALVPDGAADAAYDANVDAPLPDGHGPLACLPITATLPDLHDASAARRWAAGVVARAKGGRGRGRRARRRGSAVVGVRHLSKASPQGAGGFTEWERTVLLAVSRHCARVPAANAAVEQAVPHAARHGVARRLEAEARVR